MISIRVELNKKKKMELGGEQRVIWTSVQVGVWDI